MTKHYKALFVMKYLEAVSETDFVMLHISRFFLRFAAVL